MVANITLKAKARETSGKGPARRMRREGWMPAIIISPEGATRSIQMNRHDFEMTLKHHGRDNLMADIDIEGAAPVRTLLKEIQYEPVHGDMIHADFLEISMTRKMRVSIPLRLVGDPVGVTQQEGILEHTLRSLDVECLPGDIIDHIDVDVSALSVGAAVFVRDLKVGAKLTLLASPDLPVASVLAHVEEKEEEVAAAETAPAEPELIGRKKEEGEEGAEGEAEGEAPKAGGKKEAAAGKAEAGKEKAAAPEEAKGKSKEKKPAKKGGE